MGDASIGCALFPAVIVAAARLVNIITSWFLFFFFFFLLFFPVFYDPGLFSLPRCVTLLDRALSLFLLFQRHLFIPEDATFTTFADDVI